MRKLLARKLMILLLLLAVVVPVAAQNDIEGWMCPSGKTQCQSLCYNTFKSYQNGHPCTLSCGGACTLYPVVDGGGGACEDPGDDPYEDYLNCLNRCDIQYQCYPVY